MENKIANKTCIQKRISTTDVLIVLQLKKTNV